MDTSMKFLTFLTLLIGYFVYITYQAYLMDIAIASLMAISFGKLTYFFSTKIKNRYILSSFITFLFLSLILLPILYFLIVVANYIAHIDIAQVKLVVFKIKTILVYLPDIVREKIEFYLNSDNIQVIYNKLVPIIASLTTKSAFFIKDLFLIIIFFFFAVLYSKEILTFLKDVIPLDNKKLETLFFNTSEVMSVVFYSTILTAILEGVLFGALVYFFGFDFIFFTIMYAFASLIPVIGGIIMWGPISGYLYAIGKPYEAISLIIYSIVVISIIADTFIKPIIIKYVQDVFKAKTNLNSLLIFFSIVAGLSSFGIWGIIIGPAVTALFISILNFYKEV